MFTVNGIYEDNPVKFIKFLDLLYENSFLLV
jgi:hypothetical protein